MQDKAEERVRAQEARAEAQRQAKELEQADWHRLQHERELGRHKASLLAWLQPAVATCLCRCLHGCAERSRATSVRRSGLALRACQQCVCRHVAVAGTATACAVMQCLRHAGA